MKRAYLLLVLYGLSLTLSAQSAGVELQLFPEDEQLYPRQIHNNLGLIAVRGLVLESASFTSVRVKLYREGIFQESFSQIIANTRNFQFEIPILAELANYRLELYGVDAQNTETSIASAQNLVAGDVYIINGQSNAQARVAPYPTDNRPFARTFTQEKGWVNAQFAQPSSGQWGARMAANIIDEEGIPVAVFNESVGGKRIAFYLRDEIDPSTGNYGDLFRRLEAAEVREQVRAAIWFQGEADGWIAGEDFIETYKNDFKNIHRAWSEDYNIEKCYILQVRYQSCSHLFPYVMEAQRQLQDEDANILTMSTTNTAHDGCHYDYEGGYETIGNRLYHLMASELYNRTTYNVAAPNIRRAYLSAARELTIELRNVQGELDIIGNPWQEFRLEGADAQITTGRTQGNRIILSLSDIPIGATGISYLSHVGANPPWINNDNGVGLLTFYDFPIESVPEGSVDLEVQLQASSTEYVQFQELNYEVIIRNTSELAATNIVVEVPIPDDVAFVSSAADLGTYFSWENNWLIEALPANTNARLEVTVFPLLGEENILAYAQVSSVMQDDPDSSPNNGSPLEIREDDEARLSFVPTQQILEEETTDIALGLTSNTQEYAIFSEIDYVLRIKNNGEISATNLEIDLDLSPDFAYTSHRNAEGHYDNWNTIWRIPELASGETTELYMTLFTLTEDSPLRVEARLFALDQIDDNANNDVAIWTIRPWEVGPKDVKTRIGLDDSFQIYPSMVEDLLQMQIHSESDKSQHLFISDLQGRIFLQRNLQLNKGSNSAQLNCSNLQAGIYFIYLDGRVLKFVKQ